MMNWRHWVYIKLVTDTALTSLVAPENIYAAGSIEGAPKERPFILVRVGDESPELRDDGRAVASSRTCSIWVYDEPGSYDLIDQITKVIADRLQCQVERSLEYGGDTFFFDGGIQSLWEGDSPELADDIWAAITRNTNYRFVGSSSPSGNVPWVPGDPWPQPSDFMTKAVYDPNLVEDDVFDLDSHVGNVDGGVFT